MLTLVLSLFVLITSSHSRSISPVNYAIIFDGGSKGTRLNLFSIRLNDNTNHQLLYQEEIDINLELYCELNGIIIIIIIYFKNLYHFHLHR